MKKLFLMMMALAVGMSVQADNPYKKFTEKLPFAMPEVSAPVIPDYEVKLTDFGAVGDGVTLNTEAFAKAIDALSKTGGGKLVVPQGVWHTGPIVLKSNIELNLKAGAVILFAADETLYPIIETSFEGLDTRRLQSPIYAKGATNIAITGKGVIDGNGQYWRPVKKGKVTEAHWKELLAIPGSQELADTILPIAHKSRVCVLANHGTLSWGDTVEHAYWWTEMLDGYCRLLMLAHNLGNVGYFSRQDIQDLLEL